MRQGAEAIAVKLLRPAVVADVRRLDVVGVGLVGPNEEVLLGQTRVGFDACRVLGSGLRLKNSEARSSIAERGEARLKTAAPEPITIVEQHIVLKRDATC